uniref:AbiEi antitoxin C-terminal domain-containing protein n=1 Tax=candidate division WOR-3 bacterium TaxID=2052148 RepID=A0A7C6A7X5_UNCW3
MLSREMVILQQLNQKVYFTIEDLVNLFQIKPASAKVLAARYCKKGIFLRLKKGFYVLRQNWQNYTAEDFFKLANLIQVPSYVSFMTALDFYEITTQVQRNFIESAAQKRTVKFDINGTQFVYYKLKKSLYFDFIRQNDIFIATKEKAFLDAVYLNSFGKYKFDIASIDLTKLNQGKIQQLVKFYPTKTKNVIKRLYRTQ